VKQDDGRVLAFGAIGLLAVAGAVVRRRGSNAVQFVGFAESDDPLNYGGGILFRNDYDEFVLETWSGLDRIPGGMIREKLVEIGRPDLDPTDAEVEDLYPFTVSQIILCPDLTEEYDWVDWDAVSTYVGLENLRELAASPTPHHRAGVMSLLIDYYGAYEFDHEPFVRTGAQLKDHWPQLRGMTKRISFRGETMVPRRKG